jgi:hypothetical protein
MCLAAVQFDARAGPLAGKSGTLHKAPQVGRRFYSSEALNRCCFSQCHRTRVVVSPSFGHASSIVQGEIQVLLQKIKDSMNVLKRVVEMK